MASDPRTSILFVLPNFDTGGSEKLVLDIIRNLDSKRYRAVVAVFFNGEYAAACQELGCPLYVVHPQNRGQRSKWETAKFLSKIVREEGISIVNSHHTCPLIQGLVPFKVLNRVFWIHTEHTRLELEEKIKPHHIVLERAALRFVDLALGISEGVMDYYRSALRVPEPKLVRILNGVKLDRFQLDGFDRDAYRRANDLDPNDFVVGMFANFRPQKNHESLLRAVAALPEKDVYRFRLLLAGTGETMEANRRLSEELGLQGCVRFLGARHDIPKLLNALDAYVLPSRYEGLPFSLIEAMAAGKPIVATDVVGNKEVTSPGRNALVVPDDDSQALSDALSRLMKDKELCRALGDAGRLDAKQFSFDKMIQEYNELFRRGESHLPHRAVPATC